MNNCTSALGFAVFIFLAWLLSANRRAVCWRPVLGGMLLQFIFALLIFCFPATRSFFVMFSNGFTSMINLSQEGIVFVFGSLGVTGPPHGFILAFQVPNLFRRLLGEGALTAAFTTTRRSSVDLSVRRRMLILLAAFRW